MMKFNCGSLECVFVPTGLSASLSSSSKNVRSRRFAALRHMMRVAGKDKSREAGHASVKTLHGVG
jgi:hypothetical protein